MVKKLTSPPKDANLLAKAIVDLATGTAAEKLAKKKKKAIGKSQR